MNSRERSFLGKMKRAVAPKTYEKIEQVMKKPAKSSKASKPAKASKPSARKSGKSTGKK